MLDELIVNYGPWIKTLLEAIKQGVAGAEAAHDALKAAFDDKTPLSAEQENNLKKLTKDAKAGDIVSALTGDIQGKGSAYAQAQGGAGGNASTTFGGAQGGAGGSATSNAFGGAKQGGK